MKAIKLRLGAKLQRWHLDVGSPSVVELSSWGVRPDRVFPLVPLHSPLPPRTHSTVTPAVALTPGGRVQSPREAGLPRAWGKAGREKEWEGGRLLRKAADGGEGVGGFTFWPNLPANASVKHSLLRRS